MTTKLHKILFGSYLLLSMIGHALFLSTLGRLGSLQFGARCAPWNGCWLICMTTDGIFRLTGPVQIWLSDDQYRVPVKVKTSISLGQITAELVSAESEREYGAQVQ